MLKEWRLIEGDLRSARRISKSLDISLPVSKLLVVRGLTKTKKIKAWLAPNLNDLHKAQRLTGTTPAAKLILKTIEAKKKICVFGDFDVDGISSTALLVSVIEAIGGQAIPVIPDRFGEGYGLNEEAIRKLVADEVWLLITVDCGISNVTEIELAKKLGLKVVIVDHHEPPPTLPAADVIIDPHKPGCTYPFKDLAGVGLAFKLAQVLASLAGNDKIALDQLDLVALGTVADLAPLVGENRVLVHQGLAKMEASQRPGIARLRQVCGLDNGPLTATQISFGLAPRLNASGRLASAKTSLDLLLTRDPKKAQILATELNNHNRERQKIEKKIFSEATSILEVDGYKNTIILGSDKWHEGVKGIVASRLVERFFRPTILFSIRDGLCVGSGRSIPGFDLHKAIGACERFALRWGGHKAAAGVTIREEDFDKFRSAFEKEAAKQLDETDFIKYLVVDMELGPEEIEDKLVDDLAMMAPFGAGNPAPVLALKNVFTEDHQFMGSTREHVRLLVQAGRFVNEAVAFRVDQTSVLLKTGEALDMAFHLSRHNFKGRERLQLKVIDARKTVGSSGRSAKETSIEAPLPGSGFLLPAGPTPIDLTKVRFIDKRGTDDRDGFLKELVDTGLPTAIYVRDEYEGVKLANRLAKQNKDSSADVAITCQALNGSNDLSRLVIYQAPLTVRAMLSLCATPDGSMTKKLVYLLYDKNDLVLAEKTMESLCPDRQRLAEIYRLLREHGPFDITEAAGICRRQLKSDIYQPATRQLATRAVKILVELKLIGKNDDGKLTIINSHDKVDLETSLSWRRARKFKSEFIRFADIALITAPEKILREM